MLILRYAFGIMFWVGVFRVVKEWRYSRRHGLLITLAEKLYLALAVPIIFANQLVLDLAGVPFDVNVTGSFLAMGLALNAWPIRRRIQRRGVGL